jgi:hypothetical protein
MSGTKRSDCRGAWTRNIFIGKAEGPGIAKQSGSVCIRITVLAPAPASPSAAAVGSAARFLTRVNPSAAVPVAYHPLSVMPGLAFSHLSAASLGACLRPILFPVMGLYMS